MRSAALIFGLLAGLLGGAVIALGNIEGRLAANDLLSSHPDVFAKLILYVIPNLGLLGAGLALARPRIGGLFMLLSAAAWAAAAFLAGHGAVLYAALPFTFVAAGGLVALFSRRVPGPEAGGSAATALAVAPPPLWPDEPRAEPAPLRPRLGAMGDSDDPAPASRQRGRSFLEDPVDPDEEPAEDFIDAVENFDDPEPDGVEEGEYEETEPPFDTPEAEEFDGDDDPAQQSPRGEGRWSLPEGEDDEPRVPATRYAPERRQPPSRRAPLPQLDAPRSSRRTSQFDVPANEELLPDPDYDSPRDDYKQFEPYDPASDTQRRRGPLSGFLRLLVVLLIVLVVAGIAAAVYINYQPRIVSLLFGNHAPQAASSARPAAPPPAAATPALAANASGATADTPAASSIAAASPAARPATGAALPPASGAADTGAADATAGAAPALAGNTLATDTAIPGDSYADPFKYCASVDTIDTPDERYTGPAVPHAVAAALKLPDSTPADQARWRCVGQRVLACNANHSAACDLTPTADLMISYCGSHPDAKDIPAPNGAWSCNGKQPVIPADQQWPVDARGFYPGAWTEVPPAAASQ